MSPTSVLDMEAILVTEIVEYAFSFATVPKGQEAYSGLPHLQAYRLLHARELAGLGLHAQAQKYCDAIGATLKLATKGSPLLNATLLGQVKELSDRLSRVAYNDKGGSWISRKVQRPTLDNVWSTLEGRFAKFVAGDESPNTASASSRPTVEEPVKATAGPFAHYSSITPAGPDSISRATSATDLSRQSPPPQPQPSSAPNTVTRGNKTTGHHRRSSSYSYGPYGAEPYPPYVPQVPEMAEEPEQPEYQPQVNNEPHYGYVTPQNDTGWWSSANGSNGNVSDPAQQESPFAHGGSSGYMSTPMYSPMGNEQYGGSHEGLMSPMQMQATTQHAAPPSRLAQVSTPTTIEDIYEDDLGLGNNANKKAKQTTTDDKVQDTTKPESTTEQSKKEEDKSE